METNKNTLYQKLALIQKEVKGLGKDKDGHGYKYVTGSKVLEYIKPLMIEHGILLKQEILSIDNERQDYKTGIGTSYEKPKSEILSKVMLRFTWIDCETGDKDENLFGANGQNDWDKGVGSALTYAERYFLLKYFHINTDEDDIDNPDRKPAEVEAPKEQPKAEVKTPLLDTIDVPRLEVRLRACDTLDGLVKVWDGFTIPEKDLTVKVKDEMKVKLTPKKEVA